jgi:peptidoglycan/xylan/chitin deacetylase (PgdA/CDA1 family)
MKRIKPIKQGEILASNLKRSAPQTSNDEVASSEALLKPQTSNSEGGNKPLASVSLDLDNLWSYMKTHGDSGWDSFPSYLDTFIPLVLDVLDELDLKITFFIVGQDAALEKNHYALKMLTETGHEVGNHSFNHEPWLHLYPKDQIRKEILKTEEHIQQVTSQKPVGFRGPGFVWSSDLLEVLADSKYLYDASILPTYIGPFARMYYFWKSDLSSEEKAKRGKIYSSFREGFRPVQPYYWHMSNGNKLLEIPVTTIPIFKTPFHLSYLIYLSRFSRILMILYLKTALTLCRMTATAPSFLLHPLDFIGCEEAEKLSFFPGMDISRDKKLDILNTAIKNLRKDFTLVNMSTYARSIIHSKINRIQYPN